jgi:glycosyltransferase involved in cell wall biosynthesis
MEHKATKLDYGANIKLEALLICAPYPEGAAMAIARAAIARDCLVGVCGSAPPRRVLPGHLARRSSIGAARYEGKGVPEHLFIPIRSDAELARLVVKGLRLHPATVSRTMYWQHRVFDRSVARGLRWRSARGWVLGLPGAAQHTFERARQAGVLCALHFVNSHPRVQNHLLATRCGLPASHHEMVPESTAIRVERELELADIVLAPSEFVADQIAARGVSPEKVVVAPYGVDDQAFVATASSQPHSGTRSVVFVGQVSYRKGVDLLVGAMTILGTRVIADLYGALVSPELLRHAPPNVLWHGSRSHQDIAQAMRRADVLVLPSVEDACALVVAEALSSGIPVVTTTTNGSSRYVTHGRDGLVLDAPNAVELADAIAAASDLRGPFGRPAGCPTWKTYGASILSHMAARIPASGALSGGEQTER